MTVFSWIKCMLCLIKCSKYLYFAKKAVCITAAVIAVILCISLSGKGIFSAKKLKEMF